MLTFEEIKGQETVISQLRQSLLEKRIGHAFLFSGPSGVGKGTTALALAAALNCLEPREGSACGQCSSCRLMEGGNHPNLFRLVPGEWSMKIEQIRQLQQSLSYKRWGSGYKVAILEGAEAMTPSAANSMLKILEEPPPYTCLILITDNISGLLPTIISRCQNLLFHSLSLSVLNELLRKHGLSPQEAEVLARLSGGSMARALELVGNEVFWEERRLAREYCRLLGTGDLWESLDVATALGKSNNPGQMLDLMELWLRDLLVWQLSQSATLLINYDYAEEIAGQQYAPEKLKKALSELHLTRRRLRQNANKKLALEVMALKISRELPVAREVTG